jgi:hypothetical protein
MSTPVEQTLGHAGSSSATARLTRKRQFAELVQEWRDATAFTSSATAMAMHPAYQQIIGMGDAALPLIFQELRRDPDHWFWALKAITGEDPVAAGDRGQLDRMTVAWLNWAAEHGY